MLLIWGVVINSVIRLDPSVLQIYLAVFRGQNLQTQRVREGLQKSPF